MASNTIIRDRRESSYESGRSEAEPKLPSCPGDPDLAAQRARMYQLVSLVFERPDDDFETLVADGTFTTAVQTTAAAIDDSVADAVADLPEESAGEPLARTWGSLFGVEAGVRISPYELTYLPGPLMTNIRRLADIRGFYEAFGLAIVAGRNDRTDHLCFLTEFLAILCQREAHLREQGDREGVAVVVDAQRSFLEDHLGRWYWRFVDEVCEHDENGFFADVAAGLAALVEADIDRLDLAPEWVPDHPEVLDWNENIFGDTGRGCGPCGIAGDPDQQEDDVRE